ncbi:MAG: hypothetical protein ACI828_002599 [Flavobacteriales bacterium]|jgi:hypothetical protein
MKMLYVYIGGGKTHSSVQAKIISKIRFFNDHGLETKGAFFSRSVENDFVVNEQITLYPVRKSKKKYFQGIYNQKSAITTAVDHVRSFEKDYNVIYVRYPGASYWLYKGLKDLGDKIVFEHNTKELDEIIMRSEDNPFGWSPSKLLSWLQENRYKTWSESKWAPKILKRVKLGLANTNEIVKYQIDRADGKYHCELITNGVDLNKIPLRDPIDFDGENLTLFLMRGAKGYVPYDGTDRLLNGIAQYKGKVKIKLYFIGSSFEEEYKMVDALNLKSQVFFTGKLIGDELTELLKTCHISIGTLAIHRKNQSEGSVLRVNESLARGIPVIVAYEDMELNSDPAFVPFYLKLPANDSVIDAQEICDFAQRVYSIKDNHISIRELARKNIDYSIKIKQSIDYIKASFN